MKPIELLERSRDILTKLRVPSTAFDLRIEEVEERGVLQGRTRFEGFYKPAITIIVSRELLRRPNIVQGVKLVLAHELAHIVSLEDPEGVMRKRIPNYYAVWQKVKPHIECVVEVKGFKA